MRRCLVPLLVIVSMPLFAQVPPPRRGVVIRPSRGPQAFTAEAAVKQAMEQLGEEKKIYDRDLEVLKHLRNADIALTDPMQPNNAIEKAFDEVGTAKGLNPDFLVYQGCVKAAQALEDAKRSPMSADFGRLRATLRSEATGPATRVVARNGARLQDETLAWIRIQELISSHLRQLAEITSESLRAAEQ